MRGRWHFVRLQSTNSCLAVTSSMHSLFDGRNGVGSGSFCLVPIPLLPRLDRIRDNPHMDPQEVCLCGQTFPACRSRAHFYSYFLKIQVYSTSTFFEGRNLSASIVKVPFSDPTTIYPPLYTILTTPHISTQFVAVPTTLMMRPTQTMPSPTTPSIPTTPIQKEYMFYGRISRSLMCLPKRRRSFITAGRRRGLKGRIRPSSTLCGQ